MAGRKAALILGEIPKVRQSLNTKAVRFLSASKGGYLADSWRNQTIALRIRLARIVSAMAMLRQLSSSPLAMARLGGSTRTTSHNECSQNEQEASCDTKELCRRWV